MNLSRNLSPDETKHATRADLERTNMRWIDAYRANPDLIEEHRRQEAAISEGAYGKRQLYELIQNASDALKARGGEHGRIHVLLTENALYCADNGSGLTKKGLRALMHSYLSPKDDEEIGRYGLGFKSVLAVTKRPEFHTNSISFQFDPEWARDAVRRAAGEIGYTGSFPVLRIARPLEGWKILDEDHHLDGLSEWATTIVKLPFDGVPARWLEQDIVRFPKAFLLFARHVSELRLESKISGVNRILECQPNDPDSYLLSDENEIEEWRVFRKEIHLTDDIRKDAGVFSDRAKVKLSWAVPTSTGASQSRGEFWAFFPLEKEEMSLKGILNAPWKLNDDRSNILSGSFTKHLILKAIELVLENIEQLVDRDDPGKILELLPGRLDERRGTDLILTEYFYKQAKWAAVVPDTNGTLQKVADLNLHPRDLTGEAIEQWLGAPDIPAEWAHISCARTTIRQARIDQMRADDKPRASITQWLEALSGVTQPDISLDLRIERSARAIVAAESILKLARREVAEQVRRARIILAEDGTYVAPQPNAVFLPSPEAGTGMEAQTVHHLLHSKLHVVPSLEGLGIAPLDASSELRAFVFSRGISNLADPDWMRIWQLVGRIEREHERDPDHVSAVSVLREIFGEEQSYIQIRVRTMAGSFRPIHELLLPGSIIQDPDGSDRECAVDTEFHKDHMQVLEDLGATDRPVPNHRIDPHFQWYRMYRRDSIDLFYRRLRESGVKKRPREELLKFNHAKTAGPLEPLLQLTTGPRARMTEALLPFLDDEEWTIFHASTQSYPRVRVPSPVSWLIQRHGCLNTSLGPKRINQCLGPGLSAFKTILPVVAEYNDRIAQLLDIPNEIDDLPETYINSILNLESEPSPEVVTFWAAVCHRISTDGLIVRDGTGSLVRMPAANIAVGVGGEEESELFRRLGVPYVPAASAAVASKLRKHWGLRHPSDLIERHVQYEAVGESVPLLNLFPSLSLYSEMDLDDHLVVPCHGLHIEFRSYDNTTESSFVEQFLDGNKILLSVERDGGLQLRTESTLDRIMLLLGLSFSDDTMAIILQDLQESALAERFSEIADLEDPAEKLLAAVGEESLRTHLPDGLDLGVEDNPLGVARRFHGVFGVESLQRLKESLKAAGFSVPGQWAGNYYAKRFVQRLGFPDEYAGFPGSERASSVDIPAPVKLPRLHDFQNNLVQRILGLLQDGGTEPKRGFISLPTGAGKTRITVEALVRAINEGLIKGPVLWIAQADELCEQAVRSWADVWAAKGESGDLRINRLWSTREADRFVDGPQIVVATWQKLDKLLNRKEYDWLKNAGLVVIDEAHESTAPTYTRILGWLGLTRWETQRPLLGLSATPFKSGEKETSRLAARYGRNRLDDGLFESEPYKTLQEMRVLSYVDHELLEGIEVEIPPSDKEPVGVEKYKLPSSTVNKLALNERRNEQIIQSILSKPESWSILLFALNVHHAQLMASVLTENGIPAASIYGETTAGARRHYIDKFKSGEIRVLTNYGVLDTGFDAPKVEAIYVARPVFSPSVYQQMIGRGLRGPLNGGTERCLIVNISDTFSRFGRTLAFREFEHLWSPGQ